MASSIKTSPVSLDNIPTECLIDILSSVSYSATTRSDLRNVCKRFRSTADSYEHSIVKTILTQQFDWAKRQYPGLFTNGTTLTWTSMELLFRRIAVLSSIKSRCLIVRQGNTDHSSWTTHRALTFHYAGLLILYRLRDSPTTEGKRAVLLSLPKASLAILTFTLMMSIHVLRALGPELVLYWISPPQEESRSEIELACEEVLLQQGPEFLLGLLQHRAESISALKDEFYAMPARQEERADGTAPPLTLIATLRQCFAKQADCEMQYNLMNMWYVLDEECGDLCCTDEARVETAVEKLVNGEPLEASRRVMHWVA